MQHAVSILRVSTKKQLNEGDGIENQRRGNNAYIQRKRYHLHKEFVLAETADNKERADFQGVLDYLVENKREIDLVVFWKMDRISRGGVGTYYALKSYLAKHGIRIEFATEQIDGSPVGELMESILAATARFENRLRVDRTVGVEKILTKEGYWCRGAPTGFLNARDRNGKPILRPDAAQWTLLREGLLMQLSGQYKTTEVARELGRRGLRSSKGNPVSKQGWEKICRNPIYGGWVRGEWTDGQFVRAKFKGPLSPEEWHRLQQVLDGRNTVARRLPRQKLNPEFPLRRFLRCPQCDSPVRGYPAVKKNGRRFCYYDCKNPACRFRIPIEKAHQMFVELLVKWTPNAAVLEQFRRVVLETWEERSRELRTESTTLQRSVASLREEKESLVELMKRAKGNESLLDTLQREFARVDRDMTLATVDRNEAETCGRWSSGTCATRRSLSCPTTAASPPPTTPPCNSPRW
jgi:DNA invertase Pin-like site-specific DNA recombinase